MSFLVLDIFDKIFGPIVKSVTSAAKAKAKRDTIGKGEAKMMGTVQQAQMKAMGQMDAVGPGMLQKKDGDKAAASRAPAPVSQGFQPKPWEQPQAGGAPGQTPGAAPQVQAGGVPQMGRAALTCPNGHPIDPSWDVCPYCRTAVQKGVGAAQVQPAGGGAPSKTVAIDPSALLGTAHVNKSVVGWIVAMNGQQKGQDFRLFDGRNVLGTAADCDLVIFDPYLSARHAVFLVDSAKSNYALQDLDSRNGSYVNRQRIVKVDLVDNDEIRFGQTDFRFKALY